MYRLVFEVEALEPITLPSFAGSALRGAFGRALRRLSCMTGAQTCEGCRLRRSCPFPRVFEPFAVDLTDVGLSAGSLTPPPPFAIEPPDIGRRLVAAQERWRFGMRIYGSVSADVALIVEAWRRAIAAGLTTRRAAGRLSRVLCESGDGWRDAYDDETGLIALPDYPAAPSSTAANAGNFELQFETPLRLQSNGRRIDVRALEVRRLTSDLIRRVRALAAVAADGVGKRQVAGWPVDEWLADGNTARQTLALTWFDWQRSSARQGRTIRIGGWLGIIRIEHARSLTSAIFSLGERVGLGKECVFGFGQYKIVFSNDRVMPS